MCRRMLIPLLIVVALIVGSGNYLQLQAQGNNPLVGGIWERYSVKNAQGVETGGGPGWTFIAFTEDRKYFYTAVPKGLETLPKSAKDMTKDELVKHIDGVELRRGTYMLIGTGSPYTLSLMDDINPMAPTLRSLKLQVWMENGEMRVSVVDGSTVLRWRRAD